MDRTEYLNSVAEDYSVPKRVVFQLADVLGPNEDHDGLISAIEDWIEMNGGNQ